MYAANIAVGWNIVKNVFYWNALYLSRLVEEDVGEVTDRELLGQTPAGGQGGHHEVGLQ